MTVELIVIGKTDSKEIAALVEMYARRVNFYCKFAVTALPDVRNTRNLTVKQQRTAEGEAILRQTTDGDYVVLLDERGEEMRCLQTEGLGQPFARLGYQLCALGLTTLVGLLVLGLDGFSVIR